MMTKAKFLLIILLMSSIVAFAQQNDIMPQSTHYEWPKDPLVKEKLDNWQDKKFGMIVHWGLYAVPGIIESWSICSEDWIERDSTISYEDYKKWYWDFSKKFNPTKFNPEQWAKAGKIAGMKYLVFTTKHHDGFAMFDTKQSDFSIAKGPFANNPKADAAKYVFDAFRKEGFMIGAYFSKPDWHSQYYWWQKYATADRNNNYDIRKYPRRWNKFKDFTYNQISELMNNYGSVDILWLDGGWVRPLETVNEEVLSWGANIPKWSQDIDMPKIANMARKAQPGLLMVDRTVHGPYENYQTPEQRIPEKQLDYPWESCMTLGGAWGFVPNDKYKSAHISKNKKDESVFITPQLNQILKDLELDTHPNTSFIIGCTNNLIGPKKIGINTPYSKMAIILKKLGLAEKGYTLYSIKHFAGSARMRTGYWSLASMQKVNRHGNLQMTEHYLKNLATNTEISGLEVPTI